MARLVLLFSSTVYVIVTELANESVPASSKSGVPNTIVANPYSVPFVLMGLYGATLRYVVPE